MSQQTQSPIVESLANQTVPFLKAAAIAVLTFFALFAIRPAVPIAGSYGLEFVYTIAVLSVLVLLVGTHQTLLEYQSVVARGLGIVVLLAVGKATIEVGLNVYRGAYWNLETVPTNIDRPIDYFLLDITPGFDFVLFVVPVVAVGAAWYWIGDDVGNKPWTVGTVALAIVLGSELGRTILNGIRWYVYHRGLGNNVTLSGKVIYHMARDLRGSVFLFITMVTVLTGAAVVVAELQRRISD